MPDPDPRSRTALAGGQRREVEVRPDAGERGERLLRDRVEELGRVAEVLGDTPPDLEVELLVLAARNGAVHLLDLGFEPLGVHERARVELGQGFGERHVVGHRAGVGHRVRFSLA